MSNKQAIFSALDRSEAAIVELEKLLVAIPAIAPESGGKGELRKAEALEKWLRAKGIAAIERHDAPDPRAEGGVRPNIVATLPGADDSKRLWIMAHLDVVPEGERSLWETDPFQVTVKDGKLYGRGVEDNHQGLVAGAVAAAALVEAGVKPAHTVKLLFVADEEFGSAFGIQWLLSNRSLFRKDDLIVIPDGGKPDGSEIEVAEKNICWLKVVTKGKQCHASTPDVGANAFLANCELALKLNELERDTFTARDPLFDPDRSTITPTKKEANVPNINTIPAEDVFYVDMRILPTYSVDAVLEAVDARMREVERKYGVKMAREVVQRNESPATPADTPVVPLLQKAVKEVYGVDARAVGIGGGTVGAYLRIAGYDCVVWARQDETMHQPNENAQIANIVGDAKVFALLMLREGA